MKLADLGEAVLRDYKSVRYFPFNNEAGAPFILTSDPLGYLEAWIDGQYASIKRDKKKRKQSLTKAKYFTRLSKDFYNSSKMARMPSKGTLIYYSFINLVKVFLIINNYDLETKIEHHGISLPVKFKEKLKLSNVGADGISIFHEFAQCLNQEIKNKDGVEIKFIDLLRNLPEVHEIGYALGLFTGKKRKFLPVNIQIRTNSKRNRLYYTIAYEKKFDKSMNTYKLEKKYKGNLEKIEIEDDSKHTYFRSLKSIAYTKTSDRSWKMCYPKIIKDIDKLSIVPMITRQGYKFYLDLESSRLHRLSSLLGFAYYIGTVARYRPTLNESVLKGKYQAIINEAIISCPNQFFYLLASHITTNVCAIPKAKIE